MARKVAPGEARADKPLAWLSGELKTPPMSSEARVCYVGNLAIAVLEVFPKDTRTTPDEVIRNCRRRLAEFRKVDGS